MQWYVSGYSSKYTEFQNRWVVEATSEMDAIEQVAQLFAKDYPEIVVDAARQELRAYPPKQSSEETEK